MSKELNHTISLTLFRQGLISRDLRIYILREWIAYQPLDNQSIRKAVKDYCSYSDYNIDRIQCIYGPIGYWDTHLVTDMRSLFWKCRDFNDNIERWNVSQVTDMREMFQEANSFNQPVNTWDVSNVTDMSSMFAEATAFNQPLDTWQTNQVETMYCMFYHALSFNQPIGTWSVNKVKVMSHMFQEAQAFNQPLHTWDISQVVAMESMFHRPVDHCDFSNIHSMINMFSNEETLNYFNLY